MRSLVYCTILALSLATIMTSQGAEPEAPAILFVVTGHTQLGSTGRETGYFLSEVTHPHHVLREAGFRIDFASPLGGPVQLDPKSLDLQDPINKAFVANEAWMQQLAHTRKAADVNDKDYVAIYFAGGHGAMWDFPDSQALARLTARIFETGGVVAAVCHGPAALVNVTLSDGSKLLAGKDVTGFTNEEEAAVKLTDQMPFLLEDKLKACGADFAGAPKFTAKVVVSGRLVTGQNPASATGVGEEMVKLLRVN